MMATAKARNGQDVASIVVVDDEDDLRFIICSILVREGYEVVEARNGQEALEQIEKIGRIGTLITDFEMNPVNGGDLIREIQRRSIPCARTVLMTALVESDDRVQDVLTGPAQVAFLGKPFRCEELLRMVSRRVSAF